MLQSAMQKQQLAVITGGASGIGRAFGEALAARGVEVVLADLQAALAEEVAEGIRRRGGRAHAAALDVRSYDDFAALVDEHAGRAGRLDYLFNNAGIGISGEAHHYALSDWNEVLDINVRGVCNGIQACYRRMCTQGFGRIVNTASAAGLLPSPGLASYTTSKFAVVGLSRGLRIEARRFGVSVSALCPGVVRTPILDSDRFAGPRQPSARLRESMEKMGPIAPEYLVRAALPQIDRGVGIIVVPRWMKLIWYIDRLAPSVSERLASWTHSKIVGPDAR